MTKHQELLENRFQHAKEDLLFRKSEREVWSLFRTKSDGVAIFYHTTEEFYIVGGNQAKYYSLTEIAENWDPFKKEITL